LLIFSLLFLLPPPPLSPLFPYTTLFRSRKLDQRLAALLLGKGRLLHITHQQLADELGSVREIVSRLLKSFADQGLVKLGREQVEDRKSTRLNSSHVKISYAVFCLKKKTT